MLRRTHLTLALAAILLPATAHAVSIPLSASLDCAQVNTGGTCAAGGTGTGSATISLDTGTNLLSWNISYSGLSSADLAMHFHGPALPTQGAGVQVGTGVGSPVIGNAFISAAQAADLLAGLWYLNIHTQAFPTGEIRGQVVPEPGTLLLFGAGLVGLAAARRERSG